MKNQKQLRIAALLHAYAYEIEHDSLISDTEFDKLCLKIDVNESTDIPYLDDWFKTEFSPHTGQWIYCYPELDNIARLYRSCKLGQKTAAVVTVRR